MIFQLLDNFLDTTKILSISDILNPSTYPFNDGEASRDNPDNWEYRFIITLMDKSPLVIRSWKCDNNIDKLKSAHKQVIDFWSNNQSTIPKVII